MTLYGYFVNLDTHGAFSKFVPLTKYLQAGPLAAYYKLPLNRVVVVLFSLITSLDS